MQRIKRFLIYATGVAGLGCASQQSMTKEFTDHRTGVYSVVAKCRGCPEILQFGLPNRLRVSLGKLEWVHCIRGAAITPVMEEPIIGIRGDEATLVTGEKILFTRNRISAVLEYKGSMAVSISGIKGGSFCE